MKTKTMTLFALLLAPVAGCGDNNTAPPGMDGNVVVDMAQGQPDMAAFPAAPTIGAQIDRMGRPGINTAITDPFWNDGVQTVDQHHAKQDIYNQISDPTMWGTTVLNGTKTVSDVFKATLAVYDGADTGLASPPNTCGNQFGYNGPVGAGFYDTLATVLVDDELWVDTTQTTCMQYLGVEVKTLIPAAPADCGGRTLTENTIDETYNALVIGALTGPVVNGVTSDGDGSPSNTAFPYLGVPN